MLTKRRTTLQSYIAVIHSLHIWAFQTSQSRNLREVIYPRKNHQHWTSKHQQHIHHNKPTKPHTHHVLPNPHLPLPAPLRLHNLLHCQRLRLLGPPRNPPRCQLSLHHRSAVPGEAAPPRIPPDRVDGNLGQGSARAETATPGDPIIIITARNEKLSCFGFRAGLRLLPVRVWYVLTPTHLPHPSSF